MPLFHTDELTQQTQLSESHQRQVYNGLDCCVTLEIFEELDAKHGAQGQPWSSVPRTYAFEKALQAPYLEIMQRGFRIDETSRREAAADLWAKLERLQGTLNELAWAVWDKGLNPNSPKQLKDFFYTPKGLDLPEVWISKKGVRSLSCNREALEKLEVYLYAQPFVALILTMRDYKKQLDTFATEIDGDHRWRASYNIAGTETGRMSSSANAHGTGGNAQNLAEAQKYVFVADEGWKLGHIDLEQTEARDVGYFIGCLFGDWKYLDACEGGDVHVATARMVWPELGWTGNAKLDRAIADRNFYREYSYRDMAKRGAHLSNYSGSAWAMARSLKIPIKLAQDFQERYCRGANAAYPGIPRWWTWTAEQLQTRGWLETPFGFRRTFFGRPGDDTTLREAIAFLPQSTTAQRTNLALWRMWKKLPVQLLAQTHDSVTFQFRDQGAAYEKQIMTAALELMRVTQWRPNGKPFVVPGEAKVGWNWGRQVQQADIDKALTKGRHPPRLNLDGLVKFNPATADSRKRTSVLERICV